LPSSGASAKRFAQVVFDIAREQRSLDQWQADLKAISDLSSRRDLNRLLENPRIPEAAKHRLLQEALPGISPQAVNLATILVLRGGLEGIAPRVAAAYGDLVDAERGVVRALVTTATPVDEAESRQIAERLSAATGKQVKMEARVDPAIIGGMVVKLGDRLVDGSIRSKLQGMRRSLSEGAAL
jgi:F-type H+-transporting ATPase subunit delta